MRITLAMLALSVSFTALAHDAECEKKCDRPSAAAAASDREQVGVPDNAPSVGPADAKVTIVAFSDFQCPFCARAAMTLKEIETRYAGKVRVVFRNQPLPFHANAPLAARAALAAHEQGRFWEFHDALFAHQAELGRGDLIRYASQLGLDMSRFTAALDSPKFDHCLQADQDDARKLNVMGTPTFFINGRRLVGAQPLETFASTIDEELQR